MADSEIYAKALQYLENNKDVFDAYNAGHSAGQTPAQFAVEHWNTFGQHEVGPGRVSMEADYSDMMAGLAKAPEGAHDQHTIDAASFYMEQHPDVAQWYEDKGETDMVQNAIEHFRLHGLVEGRAWETEYEHNSGDIISQLQQAVNAPAAQVPSYTAYGNYEAYPRKAFEFQPDPGYQYRLKQAEEALKRAQSARGDFLSGEAYQESLALSGQMASDEYDRAYNRYLNTEDYKALAQKDTWLQNYGKHLTEYNTQAGIADANYNRGLTLFDREQAIQTDSYNRYMAEQSTAFEQQQAQIQSEWDRFYKLSVLGLNAAGASASAGSGSANVFPLADFYGGGSQAGGYASVYGKPTYAASVTPSSRSYGNNPIITTT